MESEWRQLCQVLEFDYLLSDKRFATVESRRVHDDDLIEQLASIFVLKNPSQWESELTNRDIGCVRVEDTNMYNFFANDAHVEENGFTTDVSHKKFGTFWRYAPVLDFSETPSKVGGGILRGEHTFPILQELGYTVEEINSFRENGILDWESSDQSL